MASIANNASSYGVVALLLCCTGVLLLRLSWRRQRPILMASGWLLILAAVFSWSTAVGVEFGLSYTVLTFALAAWVLIAFGAKWHPDKAGSNTVDPGVLQFTTTGHKFATFMVAGPLGAVATMLACMAIAGWADGNRANSLLLAGVVYPLVWGAVAVWVCALDKLSHATAILIGIGAAASLVLFL